MLQTSPVFASQIHPPQGGRVLSKFGASQIDLHPLGQPQAAPSFAARCFAKHRGGNSEPLAKLLTEGVCIYRKHVKLPHPSPTGASRCGSVTLGGKQRTVLFSDTLAPLRYLTEGAQLTFEPSPAEKVASWSGANTMTDEESDSLYFFFLLIRLDCG